MNTKEAIEKMTAAGVSMETALDLAITVVSLANGSDAIMSALVKRGHPVEAVRQRVIDVIEAWRVDAARGAQLLASIVEDLKPPLETRRRIVKQNFREVMLPALWKALDAAGGCTQEDLTDVMNAAMDTWAAHVEPGAATPKADN